LNTDGGRKAMGGPWELRLYDDNKEHRLLLCQFQHDRDKRFQRFLSLPLR